jgi:hypothetical protein
VGFRAKAERKMIIERLDDEILVYDTEDHVAYVVPAKHATTRRSALKALVAAGVAIAISAPTVAQAASQCIQTCERGDFGKACGPECKGTCRGRRCR